MILLFNKVTKQCIIINMYIQSKVSLLYDDLGICRVILFRVEFGTLFRLHMSGVLRRNLIWVFKD
jgi:hypothetical protein